MIPEPLLQSPTGPPALGTDLAPLVLLVDDEAFVLDAVAALLARLGCHPVLASTGEEALEALEAGLEPSLVILDMDMPGLGGVRTLPLIRSLRPNLPVVISTGGTNPRIEKLIQDFSFVTLLPKPYGLAALKAVLP